MTNRVTYVGTVMSNMVLNHLESRIKATRRAFYDLQSAGLFKNGVHATTMAHYINTAICPVMTYGCSNINTLDTNITYLDKQLANSLGLPKWCHNKVLINSLSIRTIRTSIQNQELSTLRARHFYRYMLFNLQLEIS